MYICANRRKALEKMMIEDYYTIEQVAEKLQVTRQAVHNWIKEGRLDSIKIGRSRRIPTSALVRLLEQSRQAAQPSGDVAVNKKTRCSQRHSKQPRVTGLTMKAGEL